MSLGTDLTSENQANVPCLLLLDNFKISYFTSCKFLAPKEKTLYFCQKLSRLSIYDSQSESPLLLNRFDKDEKYFSTVFTVKLQSLYVRCDSFKIFISHPSSKDELWLFLFSGWLATARISCDASFSHKILFATTEGRKLQPHSLGERWE